MRKDEKDDESEQSVANLFHLDRRDKATRSRILDSILIPFEANHSIPLKRAPDISQALKEVYGVCSEPYVASLRELLGIIGGFSA